MSEHYEALLDATLEHLQQLKARGVRFLAVKPETLQALARPVSQQISPPAIAQPTSAIRATANAPAPITVSPAFISASIEPSAPLPSPSMTASNNDHRAADIAALRCKVLACVQCPHLVRARKNVVFGVGDIHSPLMFVGEAPGADEDAQGEPFVGAAGQLLTKMIIAMGFTRQTVFIANILKCRPDTPGQTSGNRKPTTEEMKTCLPYLLAQIELIKPKVLVALGATAIEGLLGKTEGITKLRGKFQTYQGIPLMPTYHPAYLLRNQAMTEKRKVWEDMLQVLEKLGAPINEKQRGYFLKQG